MNGLGVRFANDLVVDGEFATAPFLHAAGRVGVPVVARLKDNLPELRAAVEKRFGSRPLTHVYRDGEDRVEIWDVGSLSLYHMAKSHWEIKNQGFNDAKNRYGIEPICHQEPNSILVNWLLTFLALVIERLYRIRYLHRGTHPVRSAEQLCRLLWLGLSRPLAPDTS